MWGVMRSPVYSAKNPAIGVLRQPVGPAVAQVAQPRRLAVDADVLVENQGFAAGIVVGRRVRSDLFEFADVVGLALVARHQRPGARNARLAHIKKPRPARWRSIAHGASCSP